MAQEFAKAFYNSKEWQNVREGILMRDNYLCKKCGNPATQVHHIRHITPSNIGDVSITLNAENLIALCDDCHKDIHKEDAARGRGAHYGDCSDGFIFDKDGQLIRA